jgi:hypothetical protein
MTSTLRTKVVAAARIAGFVVRLLAASLRDWSCWSLRHAPKRVLPPRTPTTSFGLTVTPLPPRPRRASSTMDRAEMADTVGQISGYQSTEPQITALAKSIPGTADPGPIWQPCAGPRNLPVLLTHYGSQDVANGRNAIVTLNFETIWNQPGKCDFPDRCVVGTPRSTR